VINGRVLFDARQGIHLPPQQRRVGYVPQDYALFPHLSVAQNVAFGLQGRPRHEIQQRVQDMLALMALEELAGHPPHALSGGQQQRVALARALVRRPQVLLLDEPFAALDAPVRAQLRQQVQDLQRRFELPTLFITHDLSEASLLADRIAVFDGGRVRQIGSPHEVLMRPADLQVARAVGVKNVLPGRIVERSDEKLTVQVGDAILATPPYPFAAGTPVHLCIRPERILLQRKDRPPRPRANRLLAHITGEMSDGLNCTLYLKVDQHLPARNGEVDLQIDLPVYVYERLGLAHDRTWYVSIPPGAVHVIPAAATEEVTETKRSL
jgi:ABC-type Fe3+/spermidine/putrescine transport system ATPase subunit